MATVANRPTNCPTAPRTGVNDDLFSMVFGESVLNDAVAIVLYRTILGFKDTPFGVGSVLAAGIMFTKIFVFSFLIGCGLGCLCAFTFKVCTSLLVSSPSTRI